MVGDLSELEMLRVLLWSRTIWATAMIDSAILLTTLIGGGIFATAYGLSYSHWKDHFLDQAAEQTINYLCKEGYVKYKRLPDGELELIPLEE